MPKTHAVKATSDPFGQKFNAVMAEKGIAGNYRAVAEIFGVRPQSVYDWIRHGRFGKDRFGALVAWSGRSLHWWFDLPEPWPAQASSPAPGVAEQAGVYLTNWPFRTISKAEFDELPPDARLEIEGYARGTVRQHQAQKKPAA